LSATLVRLQASGAGADANAVCFENQKNLRCLSSDRGHADTEGAVGPAEMCAMSRSDLGSKRGACRAEGLSQVYDRCRDKREQAAQIRATSSAWATPTRSLNAQIEKSRGDQFHSTALFDFLSGCMGGRLGPDA
jgi:hypothetical protein